MKNKNWAGLSSINIELSSRCNARCWCCGRRKIERDYPELANWGDMPFELVEKIAKQLPSKIVVQFHSDGESLLYPRFGEAVSLFQHQIKCVNTNSKLILKKQDEIINVLDTLTISVIEDDPEGKGNDLDIDNQYERVKQFLDIKKDKKPYMIYRLLGKIDNPDRWKKLPGVVATRILHHSMGSFQYTKNPTVPEIGVCLDLLHHLVIDRFGDTFSCARFNPKKFGILGNVNDISLLDIWNSKKRQLWIKHHLEGNRDKVPICKGTKCEFWGVPTG